MVSGFERENPGLVRLVPEAAFEALFFVLEHFRFERANFFFAFRNFFLAGFPVSAVAIAAEKPVWGLAVSPDPVSKHSPEARNDFDFGKLDQPVYMPVP